MKNRFFILMAFLAVLSKIETVSAKSPYPIDQVVDVRVTNEDLLNFIINVSYPNGCFVPDDAAAVVDELEKKIYLYHTVDRFDGMCTQAIKTEYPTVVIGKPPSGVYQVIDSADDKKLGQLSVDDFSAKFSEAN